ncbi:bacteriochlorophyll 4-vinyl reductase [Cognatiyoonia sp. IB215182]|uniref:bacteriochlorophyll 4-vinyl reductase n=1 Tax=Cognatiyoonia sp. IB215182 TaxID=3097353 RepID=UPI002A0CC422|nr:bacteriochlorophyll 4-vinyl reductase [Cognatiyoonia sp. IB215182]MDX8353773.1 bacteriochlorophyll 4-vinyl reductase [Cognatiyoonia sp. IB215182]
MPEDVHSTSGLIGPNAILQLLPVLEQAGGTRLRDQIMWAAGVFDPPSDAGLMPEAPAARIHQALREIEPEMASSLAWAAGVRTAEYIMAHRIPGLAQGLLRLLPAPLAAPLLSKAIAQHAWTFAGSGRFSVAGKLVFEIADNPIVRGEHSDRPLCHWHAAVFEKLFSELVDPRLRCEETACCAMGAPACRFELTRMG